jgi:hypothetical protein
VLTSSLSFLPVSGLADKTLIAFRNSAKSIPQSFEKKQTLDPSWRKKFFEQVLKRAKKGETGLFKVVIAQCNPFYKGYNKMFKLKAIVLQ